MFRDTPDWMMQFAMRPFKALLEARTGFTGEAVKGGDPFALGRRLKEDDLQLGIFHGFEFAWARQKYPDLQPLIIAVNRHPYQRACLVVRRNCKAAGPAGLKGKSLALPFRSREHCRLFLQRRCVTGGLTPAEFFSKVTTPRNPAEAINGAIDGKVSAALVDETDWEAFRKKKPSRARRIKVLARSEPFPCGVIACYKDHFTPAQIKRFRTGLVGAQTTPRGKHLLQTLRLTAFEEVPDGYDASLKAIAKAYPPPKPWFPRPPPPPGGARPARSLRVVVAFRLPPPALFFAATFDRKSVPVYTERVIIEALCDFPPKAT
jgi:ABC-type phosphate/phosphonate transport system substrate-binding protein